MIEEVGPGIFTVSAPLSLAGARFGTRMTIVRVGGDGLLLIAPVAIDDALAAAIDALGTVRGLIAPNAFHHLYLLAAAERYPDAVCFLAKGVEKKLSMRPRGARDLIAMPDPLWVDDLEQAVLGGAPLTNEVIFFHPASKTVILTDLCFNFDPPPGGWTGLILRLAGGYGKLAVSRLMRVGMKDRSKVRATMDRILDWDFDKIVVAHGHNILADGRERFREATRDV